MIRFIRSTGALIIVDQFTPESPVRSRLDHIMTTCLLINLFSTFFMTGLIWFVQIVHYPLFTKIGSRGFTQYAESHRHLTSLVVVPIMLLELIAAALLPLCIDTLSKRLLSWLALALLIGVWLATAILQVPLHEKLGNGYSDEDAEKLASTNWVRTILWTARSFVLLAILVMFIN